MLVNFLNLPGLEIPYHTDRMGNEALDGVRRRLKDTILGKLNLQLKRERKMLTMRQHELTDSQWLAVSGCLNNFPQLKAAYELKERYFKIWDFTTPEEALAEYLQWQESIPEDLAKPLRIITTAWRTWSKQILAYFECPITNRFHRKLQLEDSESLPGGERVQRAKVLFSDILQKKARKVEQVKVKKRPRFDDVPQDAMCFMMGWMTYAEPEYETRQVVRQVNLGTDLSTLLAEIDTWPTKG